MRAQWSLQLFLSVKQDIYTLFGAVFSTSTYSEKHLVVEVAEAVKLIDNDIDIEDGGVTYCGVQTPFFFKPLIPYHKIP